MITVVAMSGGVDSSAAAWLLLNDKDVREIYPDNDIIGVTHWWDELKLSSPGLQDRAASVCSRLGVPYHVIDLGGDFRSCVMDDFADNYLQGMTPNPCVRCNEKIRFTEFYNRCLKIASELPGFSSEDFRFCTGHYVRTEEKDGRIFLRKAADPSKDQSYMLYRIPAEVLKHCVFPLGSYTKERIKEIAAEYGFFGTAIKESQDICFIDDDYVTFLKRHLSPDTLKKTDRPGLIFDTEGNKLGPSRGFLHYTIGQRKGLGLGDGPWYVTEVDSERNRIVVGRKDELGVSGFNAGELNWFIEPPLEMLECRVQVRYNSTEYPCRVFTTDGGVRVELEGRAVATPGQSAVFYDGELVLGGGIIRGA
jgi:tRNA-specific 2-thiouridylase